MNNTTLVIGDPHIQVSSMQEFKKFLKKLLEYVDTKKDYNRIIVLGDVLHDHERVHSTALNVAVEFLEELSRRAQTYCLVGNHDLINNSQFLTSNHWMNALKHRNGITIVDKVIIEIWNNEKVVLVPFVPPGRLKEALDTASETWTDAAIVFAHQEIKGCKMGAIISEIGDEWDEDNDPFLVSGHIHQNQTPQSNVYYPGSAIQVAFGESEKNIIAKVPISSNIGRDQIEEIELGLQRKKIVYSDTNNVSDILKSLEKGGKYEGYKLKVCLDGTSEEFKSVKKTADFKKLKKKGIKIVHKRTKSAIRIDNEKISQEIKQAKNGTFKEILHKIVQEHESKEIKKAYTTIIDI